MASISWKLSKKLKETHLAPLGNPFSRSSSTSTITPSDNAPATPSTVDDNASIKSGSTVNTVSTASTAPSDPAGIIASEFQTSPPAPPIKPGVLVLALHEAKGFSLSEEAQRLFATPQQPDPSRPTSAAFSYNSSISASLTSSWSRPKTSGPGINSVPTIHGRYSPKYLPYALVEFDKQQILVYSASGSPENPQFPGDNTQYKFDVSRTTELSVSFFIRNPNAPASAGRSADIFIGTVKIQPRFEEVRQSQVPSATSKNVNQLDTEWYAIQYGTGAVKLGLSFIENTTSSLNVKDFELLTVVGKGSFGKVMQVMKRDTKRIYAMKTIGKAHIISRSEVSHTLAERSVLAQLNNPFIVPLKFSFQSPEKLYLVLAFVNGGELFHHLQKEQRFELNRARFYAAELLCALECLHGFNVIYRDLKPENILIDYSGHIALCDFGLCKLDMKDQDTTNTFCGTPEYLAPELLHGTGYTKTVDWWTLGVLLYEMLTGLPPFYDENTNEMYRKILTEPLHFPSDQRIMPPAAKDLLTKLLDRRPDHRLGVNGAAEIKAHPFFSGIDWRKLLQRKYEPAFKPSVEDASDTKNFDPEFTNELPQDSLIEGPMLSSTAQQQFAGWSYNRPVAGLGDAGGSVVQDSGFPSKR